MNLSDRIDCGGVPDVSLRWRARRSDAGSEALEILNAPSAWLQASMIKEAIERHDVGFARNSDDKLVELNFAGQWLLPFWPHEGVAAVAWQRLGVSYAVDPMPIDRGTDVALDQDSRRHAVHVGLCPAPSTSGDSAVSVDDVLALTRNDTRDREAFWAKHVSDDRIRLTLRMTAGPAGENP